MPSYLTQSAHVLTADKIRTAVPSTVPEVALALADTLVALAMCLLALAGMAAEQGRIIFATIWQV